MLLDLSANFTCRKTRRCSLTNALTICNTDYICFVSAVALGTLETFKFLCFERPEFKPDAIRQPLI